MLFNKLLKFFSKEKEKTPTEDSYNTIRFLVDKTGKTYIKISIGNLSSQSAEHFGYLLYLLNEGFYTQTILDCSVDLSKQDTEHSNFVKEFINVWSTQITENDPNIDHINDPLIRPTEFNIKKQSN